jgi:hypothetical protein
MPSYDSEFLVLIDKLPPIYLIPFHGIVVINGKIGLFGCCQSRKDIPGCPYRGAMPVTGGVRQLFTWMVSRHKI